MATYEALISTFKAVSNVLAVLKKAGDRDEDKITEALKAILVAASETESYLTDLNSKERERKRETSISKMWVEAGVLLRKIEPNLAERCIMKSDYWVDPDSWTTRQVKDAKITLQMMKDDARVLLFH